MPVLSPLAWCTLGLMFLIIICMVKTSLWWLRTPHFHVRNQSTSPQTTISSLRSKT